MYGGGTPWGYINQKKATAQANNEKEREVIENKRLKDLIKNY